MEPLRLRSVDDIDYDSFGPGAFFIAFNRPTTLYEAKEFVHKQCADILRTIHDHGPSETRLFTKREALLTNEQQEEKPRYISYQWGEPKGPFRISIGSEIGENWYREIILQNDENSPFFYNLFNNLHTRLMNLINNES